MKKFFASFAAFAIIVSVFAQAPQKMSYQAVIRNSSNVLVTSGPVGMRVSILQGSPSGTEVYREIYNPNPQTNANGLVTLEIGGGIPLTGTFTAINWSAGTYFIKTETDPTGGTNYTITGTSQLLSVPYALYAKTGDNVTGIVAVANGGTGSSTVPGAKTNLGLGNVDNTTDLLKPVSSATQTALNLKAPIDSPTFTGTPLAPTATAGDNTAQIATTAFVTSTVTASERAHYIGESYGGGIVFFIYDNAQHGLIADIANQSSGVPWTTAAFQSTVSNAVRDGLRGGLTNTERIVIQAGAGFYAAQLCASHKGGTYADWYLPSRYELNLLFAKKDVLGGLSNLIYWSSNEAGDSSVWCQEFNLGMQLPYNKLSTNNFYLCAIRAF